MTKPKPSPPLPGTRSVRMSAPVTKASEPLGAGAWILGIMTLAGVIVCLVLALVR